MTVVCVNRGKIKHLTVGKSYEITKTNSGTHRDSNKPYLNVWVVNDAGEEKHYSFRRFLPIEKWREKQFNNLGL